MLPKSKRLTAKEFKGLRTRLLYRGTLFDIATSPSQATKYACIVAKKRIKRAVDRNSARRKVYASLRNVSPSAPSFVLVYPTKHILSAPHTEIEKEIQAAFATL